MTRPPLCARSLRRRQAGRPDGDEHAELPLEPQTMSTGSRWTPALRADASALPAHGRAVPTLLVPQLGFDKTRGFQVINRPWTMLQFLKMPVSAASVQCICAFSFCL